MTEKFNFNSVDLDRVKIEIETPNDNKIVVGNVTSSEKTIYINGFVKKVFPIVHFFLDICVTIVSF